jgi:hypothetical protein
MAITPLCSFYSSLFVHIIDCVFRQGKNYINISKH